MALAPRDERPLHDQIIDHDLANVWGEQLTKLVIIELRRLREALYLLNAPEPPSRYGMPSTYVPADVYTTKTGGDHG